MASYFYIDNLSLRLGDFQLGPLSLQMDRTDYLVLLGPTGCGKTTLIKCIIGALGTERGHLFLDGSDIGVLAPNRRRVGYVAQITDLFPHLTVKENVGFGLRYMSLTAAERDARREKYLKLLNIEKLQDRSAQSLSGGESKKVSMARSLIVEPKLLLLDEPLGMLDHNERREMIEVLRTIHDELQTTTIHVTHDRHEAWGIAQKCAVMERGNLLEMGSVAELFRAPSTKFVAEFLGGTNIFKAKFDKVVAQTSWGAVTVKKIADFTEGYILVRPEQISLATKERHKASGEVTAVRDFGEYIELVVQLKGSETLTAHVSVQEASRIEVMQIVYLDWPNDAAHSFGAGE
jgi:ABC-type Fe3+/spermidine/putrescine transport system ATPase subunit